LLLLLLLLLVPLLWAAPSWVRAKERAGPVCPICRPRCWLVPVAVRRCLPTDNPAKPTIIDTYKQDNSEQMRKVNQLLASDQYLAKFPAPGQLLRRMTFGTLGTCNKKRRHFPWQNAMKGTSVRYQCWQVRERFGVCLECCPLNRCPKVCYSCQFSIFFYFILDLLVNSLPLCAEPVTIR